MTIQPQQVVVDHAERQRQQQVRNYLYLHSNIPQIELAYRRWLEHKGGIPDTEDAFHLFVAEVTPSAQNWDYVRSQLALTHQEALRQLGVATWPLPGQMPRPMAPKLIPAATSPPVPTGGTKKVKKVRIEAVQTEILAEFFETEVGQWVLLVFFFLLTIVDWVTNVWMLTGERQLGVAMSEATVWHWLLGGILVFTEMYFGIARWLIKRSAKASGEIKALLYLFAFICVLAMVYDLAATFLPPYYVIAVDNDLMAQLGGIIVGALLALGTTIASSKVIEQTIVCFQLARQK